jgi:hypothetical protein
MCLVEAGVASFKSGKIIKMDPPHFLLLMIGRVKNLNYYLLHGFANALGRDTARD